MTTAFDPYELIDITSCEQCGRALIEGLDEWESFEAPILPWGINGPADGTDEVTICQRCIEHPDPWHERRSCHAP